MFKYILLILTIFLLSCTEKVPSGTKCDPACNDNYQDCIAGECKTKSDSCTLDSECPGQECNLATHKCVTKSLCDPKCASWQECDESKKQCRTKINFCGEDKPCLDSTKPICGNNHTCIAESTNCEGRCDSSWQYCLNGTCSTRLGYCGEDKPCLDNDLPLCDTSIHQCIEASQGCNPVCKDWQVCTIEQTCVLKAGFCTKDNECLDSNAPLCNLTTHTCQGEIINYITPINYDAKALIITKDFLKEKFEELALIHTLTGVPTEVVTVAEICAATTCNDSDKKNDTAKAIKDYIISRNDNIDYVLLGGDIEVIPSRKVHDTFNRDFEALGQVAYSAHYDANFHTDYYYADFSQWDNNNDGIYAQDGTDTPDYTPEIAISRLSVSTVDELSGYIKKAKSYLTDYFDIDKIEHVLIITNVATDVDVQGQSIPMDAANYIEYNGRTRSIIENNTTDANINFTKLYNSTSRDWNSMKLKCPEATSCNIIYAIEEDGPPKFNGNPNFIIHMGHGSEKTLMTEYDWENSFSGEMAFGLRNDNYPIMLSCACQAGTFSCGSSEAPAACRNEDSAGERFVNNPKGGGIAYLGDATYGLGIAGGSQMMDEFLRYAFNTPNPLIGDAIFNAHKNLPHSDNVGMTIAGIPISIEAMDPQAYEWTQKVATFLGDIMLPIWNGPKDFPKNLIRVTKSKINGTNTSEIYFQFEGSLPSGSILVIKTDTGKYYETNISGFSEALLPIEENPAYIHYGYRSNKTLYIFDKKTF